MSASSVNGVQTQVAASGQAGSAPVKGSAVFGTPQASGDFLAMLMGAFGTITPVTGVTNASASSLLGSTVDPTGMDVLQTTVSLPTLGDSTLEAVPVNDVADMAPVTDDQSFTDFLKSALMSADQSKSDAPLTTETAKTQPVVTQPVDGQVSQNGAGVEAATNFDDRSVVQNTVQTGAATQGSTGTVSSSGQNVPIITPDTTPTNNLAAQLNAMTVGGGTDTSQKSDKGNTSHTVTSPLGVLSGLLAPANDTGYTPSFLAAQNGYQAPGSSGSAVATSTTGAAALVTDADDTVNEVNALGMDGAPDLSFDASRTSDTSVSLQPVSTNAQGTERGSSGVSGMSHSMVQAVALHLQSMAQNRDTRSLTVHLDPPELGKMQIKMSYGRDKSVRADVLVEKSDTLRLMEQDSATLKSALDNAGLQTDAGSLNFSLADQGAFQHSDSQAFLSNTSNASGDAVRSGDDIAGFEFKSTEEWSVDPSTGITRYNIVV